MLKFEYAKYIVDLLMDENITENLFIMRHQGITELYSIVLKYEQNGFIPRIVEAIFCKKADFILQAKTKSAVKEILKRCVPSYNGGTFQTNGQYYVEEEELIFWSYASLQGPLIPEGQKRYMELFEKYSAKDIIVSETEVA